MVWVDEDDMMEDKDADFYERTPAQLLDRLEKVKQELVEGRPNKAGWGAVSDKVSTIANMSGASRMKARGRRSSLSSQGYASGGTDPEGGGSKAFHENKIANDMGKDDLAVSVAKAMALSDGSTESMAAIIFPPEATSTKTGETVPIGNNRLGEKYLLANPTQWLEYFYPH